MYCHLHAKVPQPAKGLRTQLIIHPELQTKWGYTQGLPQRSLSLQTSVALVDYLLFFTLQKKSANRQKTDGKGDKGLRYEAPEIFETDRFFPANSHAPPAVIEKSMESSAPDGAQT